MRFRHSGHTLPELLIAMLLSMLVLAALVPSNSLGLRAAKHQQNTGLVVNKLRQSLTFMTSDVYKSGVSGCLFNKTQIRDLAFETPLDEQNKFAQSWLYGWDSEEIKWYPQLPYFNNTQIAQNSDAISILFANLPEPLDLNYLNQRPRRLLYVTNCAAAEITRAEDSIMKSIPDLQGTLQVYPFQSVIYYLKKTTDSKILYRQYLTKTGRTLNEPLVDGIESLQIGYAEKLDDSSVKFRSASSITNWQNIVAIYINVSLRHDDALHNASTLIELNNLNG